MDVSLVRTGESIVYHVPLGDRTAIGEDSTRSRAILRINDASRNSNAQTDLTVKRDYRLA
jgi:hypothetical protein